MNSKLLRIAALVVAVVVVLGMMYGSRILSWRSQRDDHGGAQVSLEERKVLYYYDAMNPQHHSDKPGKAPDGMDLVPQYADEQTSRATMPMGTVMISPEKQQLIGVAPAKWKGDHSSARSTPPRSSRQMRRRLHTSTSK